VKKRHILDRTGVCGALTAIFLTMGTADIYATAERGTGALVRSAGKATVVEFRVGDMKCYSIKADGTYSGLWCGCSHDHDKGLPSGR